MAINIPGLAALIVFYLVVLAFGMWAGWKAGYKSTEVKVIDVMLANRGIGILLGLFTTTATWVGGGYINGITEVVAMQGLIWCQAPIGYSLSLLFGGLFFVEKMRTCGSATILDPILWKYGDLMNCLLYLPALSGDVFWAASILHALGVTMKVIADIDLEISIIISAVVALMYTIVGGLWSVVYTDVVQLICLFCGLWLCVPSVMTHQAASSIADDGGSVWMGTLEPLQIGKYVDFGLLLIFGGIPWQVYFQRILGARSTPVAKLLSCMAALFCFVMGIPAVVLGALAKTADWNQTEYGNATLRPEDSVMTLPLTMVHLCPIVITFMGLGSVAASLMSSTDAAILSSGSMFARNVFRIIWIRIVHKDPSEKCQLWALRLSQIVIAAMACAMAIAVDSIYYLATMCSDFVYVILYPQLICVLYLKKTNSYGSLLAFASGLLLRLLGGEQALKLPATIYFPWYDEATETQMFPFRTLSMLVSLSVLIGVSYLTDHIFKQGILPLKYDIYGCFQDLGKDSDEPAVKFTRAGEAVIEARKWSTTGTNGSELRNRKESKGDISLGDGKTDNSKL